MNHLLFTQIINLDRSPERLAVLAAQLEGEHIAFTRFPAYDGRALDLDNDPLVTDLFDLDMWKKRHHRNPISADIGCYLSHYHALKTFLAQGKALGLILEDDAQLDAGFAATIAPAILGHKDWDILKLHARHPGPRITRRTYDNGARLCSFITKHSGATAYVVTKHAARKMLAHMEPAVKMNDWVYDEGHKMGLRVRTLNPMPVGLQAVPSTIETESARQNKKRSWLEKHTDRPILPRWSLPFRRIGDDAHRIAYNLFWDGGLAALLLRK